MKNPEWPLMVFTLLAQISVGLFIALHLARVALAKIPTSPKGIAASISGNQPTVALDKSPVSCAYLNLSKWLLYLFPLVILAALSSLFHLLSPLGAVFSVRNIGTSWLSREILSLILLGICWVGTIICDRMKMTKIGDFFGWAGTVFGVLLVFAIAKIYMIPIQPAWSTPMTMILFYATAIAVGFLIVAALLNSDDGAVSAIRKNYVIASLISGILAFLAFCGKYLFLSRSDTAEAVASATLMSDDYLVFYIGAIIFLFVGAFLLGMYLYKSKKEKKTSMYLHLTLIAFPVALLMERIIFYSTNIKIGL